MQSRRDFLISAASAAIAGCGLARTGRPAADNSAASRAPTGRLPLGFSTLGTPAWSWSRILDVAAANGYAAIELRGLEDKMDLTLRPEFSAAQLPISRRQLDEHGLRVVCLGASASMHEMDAAKRAAQLDEGRRFIDLAQALGAPYVRVFGNEFVPDVPRDTMLAHIASGLRELGEHAAGRNVTVLLESHGDFTQSPVLVEIMERVSSPAVAILWDAHHTYVSGKEQPESSVQQLGRWIRHTHLKDSVPAGNDRRYVLTGRGEVPVERQIVALARSGYRGYYSFEWEKRWHPEIEAPEIAIPDFASVAGAWLRKAGVTPYLAAGAS
ncbi:MAG TPA: sugar phosphate isomerase/epimerase family protein [Vicinamibacterales bacterium]|nr:sugar phosphate isomerase/epimerase family protein [Vicinamibacterales bacterium]